MPVQLELGPLPAPSRFLTMVARPVLTGTSVCAAERAAATGDGQVAAGSLGGVRRAREAPSAVSGAARRPPRERRLRTSGRCDLVGARLTPLGALHGPKAAPGGL